MASAAEVQSDTCPGGAKCSHTGVSMGADTRVFLALLRRLAAGGAADAEEAEAAALFECAPPVARPGCG